MSSIFGRMQNHSPLTAVLFDIPYGTHKKNVIADELADWLTGSLFAI